MESPESSSNEAQRTATSSNQSWRKLLKEKDGVWVLKQWGSTAVSKATKRPLSLAFREIIRQAWRECICIVPYMTSFTLACPQAMLGDTAEPLGKC
jgi:hypothetical protein